MKDNKSVYGKLLVELIKKANMSQSEFYQKLGIKKPYFYDIVSGKANPPPPELQIKVIKILEPNTQNRNRLLKEASLARNEIPADIYFYLKKNNNIYEDIRKKYSFELLLEKGDNNE